MIEGFFGTKNALFKRNDEEAVEAVEIDDQFLMPGEMRKESDTLVVMTYIRPFEKFAGSLKMTDLFAKIDDAFIALGMLNKSIYYCDSRNRDEYNEGTSLLDFPTFVERSSTFSWCGEEMWRIK